MRDRFSSRSWDDHNQRPGTYAKSQLFLVEIQPHDALRVAAGGVSDHQSLWPPLLWWQPSIPKEPSSAMPTWRLSTTLSSTQKAGASATLDLLDPSWLTTSSLSPCPGAVFALWLWLSRSSVFKTLPVL